MIKKLFPNALIVLPKHCFPKLDFCYRLYSKVLFMWVEIYIYIFVNHLLLLFFSRICFRTVLEQFPDPFLPEIVLK